MMDESNTGLGLDIGSDKDMDERREMKVQVPVRIRVKLHGLKILEGKNISETVTEALEEYLSDFDGSQDGN